VTLDDIGLYTTSTKHPDSQRPLHAQARCVCSLVRRYLPRHKNDNAWKINVYIQDDPDEERVVTANGIASVTLRREVDSFFSLGDADKKRFAFDALREGARIVSEHHDWPTAEIIEAFEKAQQDQLVNEWRFQPKWNPSRNLRAYVRCAHELQRFQAWMCVEDRDGNVVAEQHLFDETPEEYCYFPRLGAVRWTDKSTVRLNDRSGESVADDLHVDLEKLRAM
jgi:hypothetical protein